MIPVVTTDDGMVQIAFATEWDGAALPMNTMDGNARVVGS